MMKREATKRTVAAMESQMMDACNQEPPSLANIKAIVDQQHPTTVEAIMKVTNEDGECPLHIVCHKDGSLEVVEYLHRAFPLAVRARTTTVQEWIPLHSACDLGKNAKLDVIQFLVERWTDSIRAHDARGRLALHLACFRGASLDVIQYLVEAYPGALKVPDSGGSLPLHLACDNKTAPSLEVVQWLVEQWPESLSVANAYGSLALHRACFSGTGAQQSPDVIEYLVEQCPESVKSKTNDGDLPLHLASGSGAPMEVVECLVSEWPSSVEEANKEGKTPVDMAKQPFTFYKRLPHVVTYLETVAYVESVEMSC
jgi:ankyrin repeat protein